jgi:hypothetical protein
VFGDYQDTPSTDEVPMVRAKFTVQSSTEVPWNTDARQVVLAPQYDTSIPEDLRYSRATPSGRIEMQIDNPPAAVQFEQGKAFYVDFTAVE